MGPDRARRRRAFSSRSSCRGAGLLSPSRRADRAISRQQPHLMAACDERAARQVDDRLDPPIRPPVQLGSTASSSSGALARCAGRLRPGLARRRSSRSRTAVLARGLRQILLQPLEITLHRLAQLFEVTPRITRQPLDVLAQIARAGSKAPADRCKIVLGSSERMRDTFDHPQVVISLGLRRLGRACGRAWRCLGSGHSSPRISCSVIRQAMRPISPVREPFPRARRVVNY